MAFGILRNAVGAEGRVNRRGCRSGEQRARERKEKITRRRQHDGYDIATPDPALRQLRRHTLGSGKKFAERQAPAFSFVFEKNQVPFRGVCPAAMAQHVLNRLRGGEPIRDSPGGDFRSTRRDTGARWCDSG